MPILIGGFGNKKSSYLEAPTLLALRGPGEKSSHIAQSGWMEPTMQVLCWSIYTYTQSNLEIGSRPVSLHGLPTGGELKIKEWEKYAPSGNMVWSEVRFTKESGEKKKEFASYLAGLIEGDGTFAVHEQNSTAKKYAPMILIVFKSADLPLAKYLRDLTNCGRIEIKQNRGYVLWQISDLVGVFTIVTIINGYMRTPKVEALHRVITWFKQWLIRSKDSTLPKGPEGRIQTLVRGRSLQTLVRPATKTILSKIGSQIEGLKGKLVDDSEIDSNSWLTGFTDADGNFSINIHKRSNKNSTRVQLFYRLEIRQTYQRSEIGKIKESFFPIMIKIAQYLGVTLYSRKRVMKDKEFFSFIVMTHNKESNSKIVKYFSQFPLLSSKYLDYRDWVSILELQRGNSVTTSYLDQAIKIRKDFNSSRTTYTWNHLY
jgi:hypothetical protein